MAYDASELPYVDQCLCFFKRSDGNWWIAYAERGDMNWEKGHPDCLVAAGEFYTKLTQRSSSELLQQLERLAIPDEKMRK